MGKNNKFDKKSVLIVAIIIFSIISLVVGVQVLRNSSDADANGNDKIADGTLEFQATDINGDRVTVSSVPVGKDVTFHVAITTSAESREYEDFVIKFDNADFVIDGLTNDGDYMTLDSNGTEIVITIDYNDDKSAYDLIVKGWTDGTTISFDLGGHKNSESKTTATMVTNVATHGGLITAEIAAYGEITYSNTKTVNHNSLSISSDGSTVRDENGNELNGNLIYVLRGNLTTENAANATINGKINVSDVISIPAGINISDLDTLKSYLGVSGTGLNDSNVKYSVIQSDSGSNNIRQVKISYTLDSANEINDFLYSQNYTISLDIAGLIKDYGESIGKGSTINLINDLSSEYITQFDQISAEKSTVTTTIQKDQGPVYDYDKEIQSVNGGSVTEYVKKGDTITYKMTINNTGTEAGTINYKDYIPDNTEFVSASVDSSASMNISNSTFSYDENTSSANGSATIGVNGKLVLLMTVKVTSDSNGTIRNTFFDKTVSIPSKKLESYSVNKSVDKNWFSASDSDRKVVYTLTITNTGAGELTDKQLTDELPNGITYISASVGDNTDVSVSYENGVVTFSGINLKPGETKSFTVTGEIDGSITGYIVNTAIFMDAYDWAGISVEDPFSFRKYVNKIEDGERVEDPSSSIEANNGDNIEYTMVLKNGGDEYSLIDNNIVMEDVIPSEISWNTSNIYYTIGNDETTHYTANISTEDTDDGTKLIWTIDSINGSTTMDKGTSITLHVFGTIETEDVTVQTMIKNTAKITSLKKESTATITLSPENKTNLEKYVYKIFDENGNKIYENTTGSLETDQSKIPLVGENYTVVYRLKVTNLGASPLTKLTFTEKPDDGNQIGLSTTYYDLNTQSVIVGNDAELDSTHIRINVYDNNNSYKGTFTTSHIDWWGGGVQMTTTDYKKRDWTYEILYSEGVDSNGFVLNQNETAIFEFSLVTRDTDFQKVTNIISTDLDTVNSETLYGKKKITDIDKTVALTSKENVSTNQNYVDTLDILSSKLSDNYLIYKVTFNTKGYINDELEIKDVLNSNFSYVTDGVEGYDGLPIISITNYLDEWHTATLVKDEDNDTDAEDLYDEYSVSTNGNTMTIKIKPSKNRADYYQSKFTIYYLVKANGNVNYNLTAKNTASITYNENTISDIATVNIIKEKSYPGITKNFVGAYGASTTVTEGENPKLSDYANETSRLVWYFKVENDVASNSKAMEDYTISDVLPTGYEYDSLYSDSSYSEAKYYPSFTIVRSDGSKTTYSAYDGTYIEPTYSTTIINGETRNTLTWHFEDEEYYLNPGDYIEFYISCKLPDNIAKSSIAVNDVYLMINGDYETDANDDVTTFDEKTALHAQDFILVGAANVTTSKKEVSVFEEGQDAYDYASSSESDKNYIKGVVGEDITYTLNIKNDSPSLIGNIVIIDRLPYVGDKYLSTESSTGRASAFSIHFKEIAEVKIVNADGETIKTLNSDDYSLDFSDYKNVISSEKADWNKGQSEVATWHTSYNSDSDVNMRIAFNDDIQLDEKESIVVTFKATLPEGSLIESTGEDNIAWNNFAYSRTAINKTNGATESLIAESAKVGVWVEKQETQITVNKVWNDNNNFHGIRPTSIKVQLMKRIAGSSDEYVKAADPITLSGEGNTWGTVVSGLPMYENGNLLEYTFIEVDENGSSEGNIDNYETSESVETTDNDGYKVVTITNTEKTGNINISKVVKSGNTDVSSSTNEVFYFAIKDTTTNKYVLHDENNKVSSYEYINSLTTYNNLSSVLWKINPSSGNTLQIDNLILGRTYQVIETKENGVEVTNSNTKYLLSYETSINNLRSEDITYNYNITNTLKLINVAVTKVWDDQSNKHNIRPSEITIQLYANGEKVDGKVVVLNANNALENDSSKWTYTFENLRKTDDEGNEIAYTVAEVNDVSENYTVIIGDVTNDGSTISQTITNKEQNGEITVTKQVMNYGNDITSNINNTFYFILKQGNDGYVSKDGSIKQNIDKDCVYSITTGSYDNASYSTTISNLTYGKTYTVIEVEDENGKELNESDVYYTVSYENQNIAISTENTSGNAKIINTLNTTDKTVYKIWNDSYNKHNVRPASVELQLYADGDTVGDPVTVTNQNYGTDINKWEYTFTNLKKYKDDGVTEIVYTIKENNLDSHYTKEENGLTVTNTEITGSITVTKKVMNNEDDITSLTDRTFNFVLEQFNDGVSEGYVKSNGSLTANKSEAIFTIRTGENGDANFSKTITDLAIGKSYKVIEVNSDGIELTTANSDYIVTYDENQTITLSDTVTLGSTIITNTLDTMTVTVNKVWDDNDNANGFRPDSILVQLYSNGDPVGDKISLPNAEGNWTYTWNDLKKYNNNGVDKIEYTVKEFDKDGNESIKNYIEMPQTLVNTEDNKAITLTNKESLGGLTISKYVQNSNGDAIANVPDEFKGTYYVTVRRSDNKNYIDANGNESATAQAIAINAGESISISNLPLTKYIITETDSYGNPKSDDPQFTSRFEIKYSNDSQEVEITDASESVSKIVYNKIIEKTQLDVTKIWDDNNNLHKLRPDSIIIKLYKLDANGNKVDTYISKTVSASEDDEDSNTWKVTFDNLDKYDENGNEIQYTADEISVPDNYDKEGPTLHTGEVGEKNDSVTIINREESKKLTVTKRYLNNEGEDITSTAEVTFNFIVEQRKNGTFEGYVSNDGTVSEDKTVFSITVGPNANGDFSKEISGLTKNREYKVIETDGNGNEITTDNSIYEVSYANQSNTIVNSDASTVITNKLKGTSLTITKKWVDNEAHGLRKNIVVTLKGDDGAYGTYTYTLTSANNWTVSIDNLPKYRDNGVDEIVYTVEEDASTITNYEQGTIEKVSDNKFEITNTEVTGTIRITKQVLNNNNNVIENISSNLADQVYYVTIQRVSNAKYLNSDGKELSTPQVIPIKANQIKTITEVPLDTYIIYECNVNGLALGDSLNITDNDGNKINLSVSYEENIFTLTKDNKENTTIVKNKISDSTSATITKIWDDEGKNLEHRPISIDVVLYANSSIAHDLNGNVMKVTLTNANKVDDYKWQYTFTNLPKYDENGNKINYTISEENIIYPEEKNISVNSDVIVTESEDNEIVNEDNTDENSEDQNIEDDSIEKSEEEEDIKEEQVNIENDVDEVTVQSINEEIEIEKVEETVNTESTENKFYTSSIDQETLTITNKPLKNEEKIKLTIKKNWSGNEFEYKHRPESIVFIIKRTDTNKEVRRVILTGDDWYYECSDLPKYNDDLYEINYEVYELIPDNDDFKFYDVTGAIILNNEKVKQANETSKNNFEITNKFSVPNDKVSININKIWSNILDKYEDTIPNSITIHLTGTIENKTVVSKDYVIDKETYKNSEGTQWNYDITGLDKYDKDTGEEIQYKVTEGEIKNFELVNTTENYEGDRKFVVFENKQLTGELHISKSVFNASGDDISETMKLRYYFQVTYNENGKTYYVDPSGNISDTSVITMSVATGSGKETVIKNLLLDKEYTVVETTASGEKLTAQNGDYIVVNGSANVTLTESNNKGYVNLENKLQSKKITITKIWNDDDNKYEKRPTSLSFVLYKTIEGVTDSETIVVGIDECTVDGNKWTYEINNLPRRDDTGKSISYKLVENENNLEWYYLASSNSTESRAEDTYLFENKEIIGNYSLQLLKTDENGFVVPGMDFIIDNQKYTTNNEGKIIIIDRKEIYDDSVEKITIQEMSDTSEASNKKYVKLAESIDLYVSKDRVLNECKVTGVSLDAENYSKNIEDYVLLENGAKAKIKIKVIDNDITVEIMNIEQKPDLSLKKFITKVNDTEITSQIPTFVKKSDGTYTYNKSNEVLEVEDNDLITYTIRVYNEGNIHQYVSLIEDEIPQGLEFVQDNEINVANGWTLVEGSKIQSSALAGELLKAYLPDEMDEPDSREIQIVFKVVEPENSDRIVTNKAQIMTELDKDGNKVDDIDSTPGKWIEGEDDQDTVSVKVKYFDLSLTKYVTKVTLIQDGEESVKTSSSGEMVKLDLRNSELNNTIIKVEYGITIKNEGEIPGYAKKVTDYIPNGFKFEAGDNINWYLENGNAVSNELENTLLNPGESATITITLQWDNSSNKIGTIVNLAEITEDYNESNTPDIDSTPGNKIMGEDDISEAKFILTIKTGSDYNIIAIASCVLAVLVGGIVIVQLIRRKNKNK